MTAAIAPAPDLPAAPNPIDPLINGARMLASNARVILPIALVLEVVKVVAMLALTAALGDGAGTTIGVLVAALLVAVEFALCTAVVLAARDGVTVADPRELIERTRPRLPIYVATYFIAWGFARGVQYVPGGLGALLVLLSLGLCFFLLVAPSAALDGRSIPDACRRSVELGRLTPLVTFLLAFLIFAPVWMLIDGFTDSVVGRVPKTPLELWLTARGILNLAAIPIIAMTVAGYYRQLGDWADRLITPAAPSPYGAPGMPYPQQYAVPGQPYPPQAYGQQPYPQPYGAPAQPYAPEAYGQQPYAPQPQQPYAPPAIPGQPYGQQPYATGIPGAPPDGVWRTASSRIRRSSRRTPRARRPSSSEPPDPGSPRPTPVHLAPTASSRAAARRRHGA